MIRTTLTPQNTDLHLSIPKDYVGKQIEVLLYATDELQQAPPVKNTLAKLRGALKLTNDQYNNLQQHIKDIRNEWNRAI
ncbi:hypothetical protein [Chitinophaga japonensis]|uniref:Uncharacterized protein n=1 Tax=Chitinophaga japonensis TaxID=104662 RepID=A0A562TBI8_CHIJA|nr:hypothetical protein [Chitinophaga japonensis]TWI90947.1 hypothetical protein LX66_0308 [Chitinophaga japonensis]